MKNKTLQVADNLQERIPYSSRFPALSICSDHFDDYFQREWGCHWHDEFEFAVVREGVAAFTVYDGQRNETVELSPGDGMGRALQFSSPYGKIAGKNREAGGAIL